ncbi:MAG TPA: hypothetical protein VJY62_02090 [Bacteroidia bacterium]|nr:hypothetical protein [Bacteroidia bacterium]
MKKYILSIVLFVIGAGIFAFTKLTSGSVNDLEIKIENTPVIMPACYKVYGNPEAVNGRYFLFKMMLTNKGSHPIKNVKPSYEIPKFIEETELDKIAVINPGQSVVIACYPTFKDDIVNKTTSSKEKTKIKIATAGGDKEEEFVFEMKGRNEFLYTCVNPDEIRSYRDMFDNDPLVACYVTPEDPIIKYYTQQIQEKVLKGETAAVTNDPKEAVRFLLGVYQATYLSGMVYSGTSGVPSKFDDVQSLVQSLRLPREVVTGNTGLCIELSILYSSVLMAGGLEPIIFLIPGHAYPGIKFQGQYFAIEATKIGGAGIGGRGDAEEAFKRGMEELDEFIKAAQMGDERYSIINIRELIAQQITPMELKDDQFMREKVEKIAANWVNGALPQDVNTNVAASNTGGGGGTTSGMSDYNGVVSFSYPQNWQGMNNPVQGLPQLIKAFVSPDQSGFLQVYAVPGASNGNEAMQIIKQQLYGLGQEVQYQSSGSNGNFQMYNGTTYSQNGQLPWSAYLKRTGNGMGGLIVGSYTGGHNGIFQQVIGTLR